MFLLFISQNSIHKTSDLKILTADKQASMASKSNKDKAKTHSWKWETHILMSKRTDLGWLKPTMKLHPWEISQLFLAHWDCKAVRNITTISCISSSRFTISSLRKWPLVYQIKMHNYLHTEMTFFWYYS